MMKKTIRLNHTKRIYGPGEWAEVAELPKCQVCVIDKDDAYYDARTSGGRWGYLCVLHFQTLDCSLGLGKGQRLVTPGSYEVLP